MESNNSSSNTATASSSDPPPPNQRNDDKGKQTCSNESEANDNPYSSALREGYKRRSSQYNGGTSNESEVNENKNNNPESSVKKRKSLSANDLNSLPDWLFEEETPWNYDECYSEPLSREHLVRGNYGSLDVFKGLDDLEGFDPTEEVVKEEGPPQSSGGSPSQQLYHDYHPTEAENQTVANNEDLFGYVNVEPQMEHLVSRNDSLNDSKDLDSTEDVDKYFADDPELYEEDVDKYLADDPELYDD